MYQKVIDISECIKISSMFTVSWKEKQCVVDYAYFPILTISTADGYFAQNYDFEMPERGYWKKEVDIKECSDFSITVMRWRGKEREEEIDHLTEDEFIKEWKKYHNNLYHNTCCSESQLVRVL